MPVSTMSQSVFQNCPNCGIDLPVDTLVCPACDALIQSVRLDQLAQDARALELRGLFAQARELWEYSLTLLPQNSKQSQWVQERLQAIDQIQAQIEAQREGRAIAETAPAEAPKVQAPPPQWIKRLGPLGPVALLLLKLKSLVFFLLKFKFFFSFLVFIWLYMALFGWRFGLGFSISILVHELGHYIDIRRRGLSARMPIFVPGFGAYVRWTGQGVTLRQIAQISLAGPRAGWIAAAVCDLIYTQTGDPLWAALARTGAFINILNLIPVWYLDGGLACRALGIGERVGILILSVGLWYVSGERLFLFVALGSGWRVFRAMTGREGVPQGVDWGGWGYYAALLIALAVILEVVPNTLANRGMQ